MASTKLLQQVGRVRRRLFLGSLLALLGWFWVAALGLSAAWFFAQPLLLADAPGWLRWAVLGGLAGVATAAAVTISVLRAPSTVSAALSLDERFALRERVTTSLTLDPDTASTPAGAALLADAEGRLAKVRVGDRFPVALPWKAAALLPVLAAAVVLLAILWEPRFDSNRPDDSADATPPADARAAIEEQMKKLEQNKPENKKAEEPVKPEKLKEIEAEIERFTRKPRETREDIQERIKDATAIEAELQRQQKQAAERADAMREAMKQAERLTRKNRKQQDGPARDAADALAKGDMAKAKDELERLSRQLEKEEKKERLKKKIRDAKNEEEKQELERELEAMNKEDKDGKDGKPMTEKDKEDLQKQMEEMKDMVERLSRKQEELEKELKDMADKGELDKEELERELEDLKKNELTEQEKKELEDLANELKECEQCMKEGKDGEAAKKLARAAKKCEGMGKDGENAERARMQARMKAVRKALNRSVAKGGGVGAGKRPEARDDKTGHEEKNNAGEWDPKKGKVEVVGQGPKGGKKFDGPKNPAELKEEIKQAGQEAAAAIDRQRLPPSARKMARDYFEKVRGQDKGKDEKKR